MSRQGIIVFLFASVFVGCNNAQTVERHDTIKVKDENPLFVQCLKEAYPDMIVEYADNHLIWHDGDSMVYDDGIEKTPIERMDNGDIEDMSYWLYSDTIEPFNDAGRIRNDEFFKKMYGNTSREVASNLTTIIWCPKTINQKIKITTVNHVDEQLKKVSDELDEHPEWKKFIGKVSTINWRYISGTNRLSTHSYGIAIDIGVSASDYWKWKNPKASESDTIKYHNSFPLEIIKIFEKHGFIWGGRWYHYDTMHFEYRPEILLYKEKNQKKDSKNQ